MSSNGARSFGQVDYDDGRCQDVDRNELNVYNTNMNIEEAVTRRNANVTYLKTAPLSADNSFMPWEVFEQAAMLLHEKRYLDLTRLLRRYRIHVPEELLQVNPEDL